MKESVYLGTTVSALLMLSACGQSIGTCSGVTIEADMSSNGPYWDISGSIKNATNEARLVTVVTTLLDEKDTDTYRVKEKSIENIYLFGRVRKEQGSTLEELGFSAKPAKCE